MVVLGVHPTREHTFYKLLSKKGMAARAARTCTHTISDRGESHSAHPRTDSCAGPDSEQIIHYKKVVTAQPITGCNSAIEWRDNASKHNIILRAAAATSGT